MKKLTGFFILFLAAALLAGCASTEKAVVVEEEYDAHYADFDPFELGAPMGLWKSGDSVKPCEMSLYYVPRKDSMELYFSYGIDKICLMLGAKAQADFADMVTAYMTDYNSASFEKRAPSKKNEYGRLLASIAWGVLGYGRNADIKVSFNYQFIGNNPYFRMELMQGQDVTESDVYSPIIVLYFSPAQLEAIMNMCSRDMIDEIIMEKESAAYTFDTSYSFEY